ncbi:MAG: tetratricopeptide repeat protein [Bacteroidota bacterium]
MKHTSIFVPSGLFCALLCLLLFSLTQCASPESEQEKAKQQNENDSAANVSELQQLNQQIDQNPDIDSLYHKRAIIYLSRGNLNKALSNINKAISMGGKKSQYMLTLADIYFSMPTPRLDKTKQTLETILIDDPENVKALLQLSKLHLYGGKHDQAFRYLSQAKRLSRDDYRIYFLSGLIHKDQGNIEKAKQDFHRATELNQGLFAAWTQLGLTALDQNDTLAVRYFSNALDVKPESEQALYNLGVVYQNYGRYSKAIQLYNQLLDVNPKSEKGYYNLGYIHLKHLNNFEKAESYFRLALEINPSNINALYNLGSSLEQQQQYEEARKLYKQTLQMEENFQLGIEGLNRLDQKMN